MAISRKDARKAARQEKSQRKAQFYARSRAPPVAPPAKRTGHGLAPRLEAHRNTSSVQHKRHKTAPPPRAMSEDESICSDNISSNEEPSITKPIVDFRRNEVVRKARSLPEDVISDPLLAYAERAIEEGILGSDGEFDESRMDTLFGDTDSESESEGDAGCEPGMDLYGRHTNDASSSVTPAATTAGTAPASKSSDEHALVHRQVRGLLNRLALTNVEGIATTMAKLTDEYPRGVVSEAVSTAVLDSLTRGTRLHSSFVLAYAVLVAALAHMLGVDVAGRIVEDSVARIDSDRHRIAVLPADDDGEVHSGDDADDASPIALAARSQRHVLTLIAYLHALRVVGSGVVVGLAREAASRVARDATDAPHSAEADASLVVTMLQLCVAQLKREDPAALRTLLLDVSAQLSAVSHPSARMRFLSDAVEDVRNNRQRIVPGVPPADVENARKTLRAVLHSRGCTRLEPLAVTLADIRGAATRGKWWITGAAWRPDSERAVSAATTPISASSQKVGTDAKLDALARAQGMSTEVRRAVFCALMSSEDYADAHHRLCALRLGSRDEREIAHVLLHCTARETRYNPFYALVALRFLAQQHNFVVTFRYALWDRLRALEDGGMSEPHVARFFGALIGHGLLPLSVLKRVSLAQVSGETLAFLRLALSAMLEAVSKPTLDRSGHPIDDGSSPEASSDAAGRMATVLSDIFKARKSRSKGASSSRKAHVRATDFEDALAGSVMRGVSDSEPDADSDADPEEQRALLLRCQEMDALRTGLRLFARMHMSGSLDGVPSRVASAAAPLVPMLIEMLECVE